MFASGRPMYKLCQKLSLTISQRVELMDEETLGIISDQSISGALKSPHKTIGKPPGTEDTAELSSSKVEIPELGGQ